jgi:hypothetical protein
MWVRGSTSSRPLPSISSMTWGLAMASSAHREQRTKHHDSLVGALFENRFEPGRQGEHALAGAGGTAHGHDADARVSEQVEGDALLGRTPPYVEKRPLGSHQLHALVGVYSTQGGLRAGTEHDAGVARQVAGFGDVGRTELEEVVDERTVDLEGAKARPTLAHDQLVAVLLGIEAGHAGLEAQR